VEAVIPAISVQDLTSRYGDRTILENVNLEILPGTVVGVVGPNGSGKTTLVKSICGLQKPTGGRIRIFGKDAAGRSAQVKRLIGVLPQETSLYGDLSVRQNLRFVADLYGTPRERIDAVLQLVGLRDRASARAKELSGGMRRRLAIARMLLHEPPLLILDEPTIGIDVDARHQIWNHIRLVRSQGRTVLLTTNHLDEAEALCDRVILLRGGSIVADESPAALMKRVGQPLELQTEEHSRPRLRNLLQTGEGVREVTITGTSVTVFLDGSVSPEEILRRARLFGPLYGFRLRSADLAEIFESLDHRP